VLESRDNVYSTPESYFDMWESRIGYRLLLGGRRHFAYYDAGTLWPFPIAPAMRRMEDHLYESLDLSKQPGAKVLDAGCGAGQVALHLAHKGLRIQAIDITKNHVRWTQQRIKEEGMQDMVSASWGDYHNLDGMDDESFDGIYTMETLVHASDPSKALAEFYRVLKPGGHVAFHEYDHLDPSKPPPGCPPDLVDAVFRVNARSGMLANQLFDRGVLQRIMEHQGFEDIELRDLTENIRPMMRFFYLLAYIPYLIICFLGLQAYFVSTEGGVVGYRALWRGYWRYLVFTARKPLKTTASNNGPRQRRPG
ncbi:MAG: hypothetical protein Q9181_006850, partial [Wetmoreana brouardii]